MPTREFPHLSQERKQRHSPDPHPQGEAVAKAKVRMKGKPPKWPKTQPTPIPTRHDTARHGTTVANTDKLNQPSCAPRPGGPRNASPNNAPPNAWCRRQHTKSVIETVKKTIWSSDPHRTLAAQRNDDGWSRQRTLWWTSALAGRNTVNRSLPGSTWYCSHSLKRPSVTCVLVSLRPGCGQLACRLPDWPIVGK